MNIWHYRDNRDTWLYYRDGRIFIIAQPYLIVGIDKECMECNIFARLETHLTIGFSQKTDLN